MYCLTKPDQKIFYKLYYTAGDYVNVQRNVVPHVLKMNPKSNYCSYEDALKIMEEMRAHPELMVQMSMDSKQKLNVNERHIIASWARIKPGNFIIMEHTSEGSIFISEDDTVYRVIGLRAPLWDMIPCTPPVRVTTCLMPFNGIIITDGFFDYYEPDFTPKQKDQLYEIYANAIKCHTIQTRL